jgi:hypothetical protein
MPARQATGVSRSGSSARLKLVELDRPERVLPLYRASGTQGKIVVYAGPLELTIDDKKHHTSGQLELAVVPKSAFTVRIAGALAQLQFAARPLFDSAVAVPPGSALDPPEKPVLPDRFTHDRSTCLETSVPLNHLEAGDATGADRFLIHVSGPFLKPNFRR